MPVIISRAQLDRVKAALDKVKTNGQALSVVDGANRDAFDLQNKLRLLGGPYREAAAKDIQDAVDRVQQVRGQLGGASDAPVGNTWAGVRERVNALFIMLFMVESSYPPDADFGDDWRSALGYSVDHLEENLDIGAEKVGSFLGRLLGGGAKIAGEGAKNIFWEFIKKAWPVVLVGGGAVILILVARKKLDKVL